MSSEPGFGAKHSTSATEPEDPADKTAPPSNPGRLVVPKSHGEHGPEELASDVFERLNI